MKPAARVTDPVVHPLPPVLQPGPGSLDVLIGMLPAWRGVPSAVASALQAAKQVSDTAIQTAEAATVAAAGTPGLPAAKLAEETTKATAATSMGSTISAAAGMADIHACVTPLPVPPHGPGVVIDGRTTVLINNLPACCMGDTILEAVGPPNKIAMGCPTVLIGDSNGTGSSGGPSGGGAPSGGGTSPGGGTTPGGGGATPTTPPATIAGMSVSVLPNGDVKVGNSIIIKGSLDFQTKTLAALGQIASTPTGEALLQSIDKNGKTVTIQETSGGNEVGYSNGAGRFQNADGTPGPGSDANISYNPSRTSTGTEDWETRPPAVGLAHELVHAEQAGKGIQKPGKDANDSRPDATDPTKNDEENKRELEAAGIPPYDTYPYNENKIRRNGC